jgi:hypothetical protein
MFYIIKFVLRNIIKLIKAYKKYLFKRMIYDIKYYVNKLYITKINRLIYQWVILNYFLKLVDFLHRQKMYVSKLQKELCVI